MTHTQSDSTQDPEALKLRDRSSCLFAHKINEKQGKNLMLMGEIEDYLQTNHQIELPDTKKQYQMSKWQIFDYENLGESEVNPLECKLDQLIKMYYALKSNGAFYAKFENEHGQSKFRIVTVWQSRHRLDYVANFQKSKLIRSRYYNVLPTITDHSGELMINNHQACHLVLTLPHKDGQFKGKDFYVDEFIKLYNKMRKMPFWKKMIFGGEYGVETKRGKKDNGLHIHMHSLVLHRKEFTRNEVEAEIAKAWRKLTGNESTYSGINYESLYVKKRDEKGEVVFDSKGKMMKDYIVPGDPVKKYMEGVMECIKYHFKPGCLEKEENLVLKNGRKVVEKKYDIDLIIEILNNTFNAKLYGRFGAFRDIKELNFSSPKKEEETTDLETEGELESEEVILGSAEKAEARMVNPFTMQPAQIGTYKILFGPANGFIFRTKDDPCPLEPYRPRDCMVEIPDAFTVKEAIPLMVRDKLMYTRTHQWEDYDNENRLKPMKLKFGRKKSLQFQN